MSVLSSGKLAKKPKRSGYCRLTSAANSFVCLVSVLLKRGSEVMFVPGEEMLRMDFAMPVAYVYSEIVLLGIEEIMARK